MNVRSCTTVGVFFLMLASAYGAPRLIVAPNYATYQTIQRVTLTGGLQRVRFDHLPDTADVSALQVFARRRVVSILRWHSQPSTSGTLSVVADVWAESPRRDIEISIVCPIHGLTWSAFHQAVVRGDRTEEREPLSVDWSSWVELCNHTGYSFSNASVRLAGTPPSGEGSNSGMIGFLDIAEEPNPLLDLWERPAREPAIPQLYEVPRRVTLPAHSRQNVLLAHGARLPAVRRYVIQGEAVPPGSPPVPMRKWIVIPAAQAERMGAALPPGPVQLYLGSLRTEWLPPGELPHVPKGGEIVVDLGPSPGVMIAREIARRVRLPEGGEAVTFRWEITNDLDSGVFVEIDEKPPVILDWTIIRSSRPFTERFRRLIYRMELGARERSTIEYTVRVAAPPI